MQNLAFCEHETVRQAMPPFGNIAAESMCFAFSGCVPLSQTQVRCLAASEPYFDEALHECDRILAAEAGWTVRDTLGRVPEGEALTELPLSFPLNVALQIAMLRLLRHYGLHAGTAMGISSGELTAACAAGAIGLRDALRIAIYGGRLMEPEAKHFRTALIWLPAAACADAIRPLRDHIEIAALMEPAVTAVSGEYDALHRLLESLAGAGVRTQVLPFAWGVHTPLLRHGRAAFEQAVQQFPTSRPRQRIMSTLLGHWGGSDFGLDHWWKMFSGPVLFMPSVTRMVGDGVRLFIEVGPASAISYLVPRLGARSVSFADALAAIRGSGSAAVPNPNHYGMGGQ